MIISGSDSTAMVPKSFSGYSALTIKSVSFTAANLNFSPLKTAKYGFSPAHENASEPESPYNTAMKNRPISLARMAGVSFSPVDFSAFPNFKAYTPGSSRRHNGSVSNQRAGNWSPEGSENGKQNGDESTNKNGGKCYTDKFLSRFVLKLFCNQSNAFRRIESLVMC